MRLLMKKIEYIVFNPDLLGKNYPLILFLFGSIFSNQHNYTYCNVCESTDTIPFLLNLMYLWLFKAFSCISLVFVPFSYNRQLP